MRIMATVQDDSLAAIQVQRNDLADKIRQGLDAAGAQVQATLRGQVRAAGLGPGLEKAWRTNAYPSSPATRTLHPTALVFSKATLLHQVFDQGATIHARVGRYLAIPTKEAEAMGFATSGTNRAGRGVGSIARRASMVADAIAQLGDRNIAFLPMRRGGRMMVFVAPKAGTARVRGGAAVSHAAGQQVPLFLLIPSVRLLPKLDIGAVRAAAQGLLSGAVTAALR